MTQRSGIAAQINMYPMDVHHVEHLLPHQMRVWEPVVDRVMVTVDVHRSRTGRYRGAQYAENLERLRMILAAQQARYPKLEVKETDYSPSTVREVARYFFGTDSMPVKAWDGGPFYTYFYGLYSTNARYIVHFDGDIFFGGGSHAWLGEAMALMEERPDVLFVCPFSGPPRADGLIFGHQQDQGYRFTREPGPSLAYRFAHVSTRFFFIDLLKFEQRIGKLPLLAPSLKQRLKAKILGNPPDALEAEMILSKTLARTKHYRIDFLGSHPGLWGLHPLYRSKEFYRQLPQIVDRIERGAIPDGQRGHYDINDSFVDLSDARAATRWHRRYLKHIRDRFSAANAG